MTRQASASAAPSASTVGGIGTTATSKAASSNGRRSKPADLHLDQHAGGRSRQLDAVRDGRVRLDGGHPSGQPGRGAHGRDQASIAAADDEDAVAEASADHLRNQVRLPGLTAQPLDQHVVREHVEKAHAGI